MELKIFGGRSNPDLTLAICRNLGVLPGEIEIKNFADGEIYVRFSENLRGEDVFLVQSTNQPYSNLFELLIMLDAAKRASAGRITAVVPYFGHARQERKSKSREPITAKLIANMIMAAGGERLRVLTMDLHANPIEGFFEVPVDHLYARPVAIEKFRKFLALEIEKGDLVIVAPDAGAVKRARAYAERLNNAPLAIMDKRRENPNEAKVMNVIGEVSGKTALIIDDMIDTAGTLQKSAVALAKKDAVAIYAFATHGVLSRDQMDCRKDALSNIHHSSSLTKVFITDTLPKPSVRENWRKLDDQIGYEEKIEIISVASLFAQAIKRIHDNQSISSLFE